MKKKYIVTGLTCAFLMISGICYSCAYQKNTPVLISSVSEGANAQTTEEQTSASDNSEMDADTSASAAKASKEPDTVPVIYAHICGAVVNPGVYQVETGARLVDLIGLSGGLTQEADGDYINQAQLVSDGQRIYIPTKEELKNLPASDYQAGEQGDSENSGESSLININTADSEELMSLPGIGQAKADSIISYRASNGTFQSIEDLMNIPGIKEGLFGQISSLITVN
jgi:competence protein ComEA